MSTGSGQIGPIAVESLGAQVARHLRRAILSGRLTSGTRLIESVLAKQLEVSRGPVREALAQLETEGLVRIIARRGAVVSELDLAQAWEVYTLRGHLEMMALSALRHGAGRLEVAGLKEVLQRMDQAGKEGGDPLEWVELDLEFHRRLCDMSGMVHLTQLHESLNSRVGALFLLSGRLLHRRAEDLPRVHRPIVQAMEMGDLDQAVQLVGEHYFEPARAAAAQHPGAGVVPDPWSLRVPDTICPAAQA